MGGWGLGLGWGWGGVWYKMLKSENSVVRELVFLRIVREDEILKKEEGVSAWRNRDRPWNFREWILVGPVGEESAKSF